MPPTRAAPRTPQAAVCIGTAAPLEVEVEVEEEDPLCAWPSEVDSLALREAEAPVKAVAARLVLLVQADGVWYLTSEENWISAHCIALA